LISGRLRYSDARNRKIYRSDDSRSLGDFEKIAPRLLSQTTYAS